jgi:hypothetical protein
MSHPVGHENSLVGYGMSRMSHRAEDPVLVLVAGDAGAGGGGAVGPQARAADLLPLPRSGRARQVRDKASVGW